MGEDPPRGRGPLKEFSSTDAILGLTETLPVSTSRIAAINRSPPASFITYPRAPARSTRSA